MRDLLGQNRYGGTGPDVGSRYGKIRHFWQDAKL